MSLPWRVVPGGVELRVRLTPKGGADRIDGAAAASDGVPHLAARVRAVPEKGAANEALRKLLAGLLGVPASSVSIASGATSRVKTVRVSGEPQALCDRLAALAGGTMQ